MKRVLLTGGSGFIGRNINESFLSEKHELVCPSSKELNMVDTDNVDAYFGKNKFDVVIHAGAKPGHRNAIDPTAIFYTNSRMFFNLIRNRQSFGRLLNIGSGAIYDMRYYEPKMRESYFGVHIPVDEHGYNKYVCGQYMEACNAEVIDLRIFGIFGKYEDYAIRFISNAICKTLFDLPVTLRQDKKFDYLYIDDLMPILDFFIENKPLHKAYNITPDSSVSLLYLARKVIEISGKDLPVLVASQGLGMEYSGNNERLRAEMDEFGKKCGFTPIEKAIQNLYDWYKDHQFELNKEQLLRDK